TEQEIRDFISAKGGYLATYKVPAAFTDPYGYYNGTLIGPIGSEVNATGWDTAKIIYNAAHWYGMNPQVLLTTLEKEQSLVTIKAGDVSTAEMARRIRWAMGYSVLDSGVANRCGTATNNNPTKSCAGLAMQIDWAAGTFALAFEYPNSNFPVGQTVKIGNTYPSTSWTNVYIANRATSSLYSYTPYTNGSLSFYTIFYNWFDNWDLSTSLEYRTGQKSWNVASTKFYVSGDFNDDGRSESVTMYDYGDGQMGLWLLQPCDSGYTKKLLYITPKWSWNVGATAHLVSGDYNGDGYSDLAAMYDYGKGNMALLVFINNKGALNAFSTWYLSGPRNWNTLQAKHLVSGDFDKDGKDDLVVMYDYDHQDMGMLFFQGLGDKFAPVKSWLRTGVGTWNVGATGFMSSGDYNKDGQPEIVAEYNYGSGDIGLLTFTVQSGSFAYASSYRSGKNTWNNSAIKQLVSVDLDGGGADELSLMYDYGYQDMGMWDFTMTDSAFTAKLGYRSGKYTWNASASNKLTVGDFDKDGKEEIASMYGYSYEDMGIWHIGE
ncbi:MAG: FG-GAP-like repeat-containing protein, partial [Bacillota bacterium]|nr:FG-GAP-like repeat-containing protein [Bacillota bacterium]